MREHNHLVDRKPRGSVAAALLVAVLAAASCSDNSAEDATDLSSPPSISSRQTVEPERSTQPATTSAASTSPVSDSTATGSGAGNLQLDDIQVLASHNSYHVEPDPPLLEILRGYLGDGADGYEYTHRPLPEQLDAGVRSIELDLFTDPDGGRYSSPRFEPQLRLAPPDPALDSAGTKVFHVQEVDFRSTCPTLVSCLEQVRDWSDAHPRHVPIMVQLEPKADDIPDPGVGFVQPLPWDQDAFARVDEEIRSVFAADRVIEPGDVQGHHATLADAVRADGWPALDDARGNVLFTLDNMSDARAAYRALHPDVADRLIFVPAEPHDADAAFMVLNDPFADAAAIGELVADHFLVRTRADADTVEARAGDTRRQEAAWATGAHFVSTDYEFPDTQFGTGYVTEVPGGGAARCNPLAAPAECETGSLEP